MNYTYHDRQTRVEIGDEVEFRGGIILLFRRYRGRVVYVPGISPLRQSMEFNGMKWIGIQVPGRLFMSTPIDRETNSLVHKSVRFIRRGQLDEVPAIPEVFDN